MADEDLHQPHDKLFKEGFSDPANAAALLRQHLPAEVAALIQWDQLKLIPGSFLDDDLRHSHSDLLFSAPLAANPESSACVHLLFEHQSTLDPFIALRLLRYMVRIWEEWIRLFGNSKLLPVIFPRTPWASLYTVARTVLAAIPAPGARPVHPAVISSRLRETLAAEGPALAAAGLLPALDLRPDAPGSELLQTLADRLPALIANL